MKTIELTPLNGRKTFGGKCKVEQDEDISFLYSYGTKVAHYIHSSNRMVVNGYFSLTTATHINSFLDYYGFETCTKKQLENYETI